MVGLESVKFVSLDPEKDPLVFWFWCLHFWNQKIVCEIQKASFLLPDEIASQFQRMYCLPFKNKAKEAFDVLLQDMNGLNLSEDEIRNKVWKDPFHHYGLMYGLDLARIDGGSVIKPKKIAFDKRVGYLVGTQIPQSLS